MPAVPTLPLNEVAESRIWKVLHAAPLQPCPCAAGRWFRVHRSGLFHMELNFRTTLRINKIVRAGPRSPWGQRDLGTPYKMDGVLSAFFFFMTFVYLCVESGEHMQRHMCGGQRAACGNWFSSCIVWTVGIKLGLWGLGQAPWLPEPTYLSNWMTWADYWG